MLVRVEDIAKILVCEWVCYIDSQEIDMSDEEKFNLYKNYCVHAIRNEKARIILEITPWESPRVKDCSNDEWYKENMKRFGIEPDFS